MVIIQVTSDLSPPSKVLPHCTYRDLMPKTLVDDGGCSVAPSEWTTSNAFHKTDHGFLFAAKYAFDNHKPLRIAPEHVWLMILQGVSEHVSQHPTELQSRWVAHEGIKTLTVHRPEFVRGSSNHWSGVVIAASSSDGFVDQLRTNALPGVMEQLMRPISTATSLDRMMFGITAMTIMRHYFKFEVLTECGIPWVRIDGTLADWTGMIDAVRELVTDRCTSEFSTFWLPSLTALLQKLADEFAAAEQGRPSDAWFWNTICKSGARAGSGAVTWIDGWINVLMPFQRKGRNEFCRFPLVGYQSPALTRPALRKGKVTHVNIPQPIDTWFEDPLVQKPGHGMRMNCIPCGTCSVPVTWKCRGEDIPLDLHAGFLGIHDGDVVEPVVGWYLVENRKLVPHVEK